MKSNKNIYFIVIVLIIGLFNLACDDMQVNRPQTEIQRQKKEQNTESLLNKQPLPPIPFSMDRDLLIKRLTRFNDPNKMNYLYIFAGNRILELTIVGKVTSTSKRLTDPEKWSTPLDLTSNQYDRINIADEMGTWGSSNSASLAMTTLGSLVEFRGFVGYFYSEVQFEFAGEPITKININLTQQERTRLTQELDNLQQNYNKSK